MKRKLVKMIILGYQWGSLAAGLRRWSHQSLRRGGFEYHRCQFSFFVSWEPWSFCAWLKHQSTLLKGMSASLKFLPKTCLLRALPVFYNTRHGIDLFLFRLQYTRTVILSLFKVIQPASSLTKDSFNKIVICQFLLFVEQRHFNLMASKSILNLTCASQR